MLAAAAAAREMARDAQGPGLPLRPLLLLLLVSSGRRDKGLEFLGPCGHGGSAAGIDCRCGAGVGRDCFLSAIEARGFCRGREELVMARPRPPMEAEAACNLPERSRGRRASLVINEGGQ